MIWNAYAAWTWEVLRRHPEYIKLYNSLVNKGLENITLGDKTLQITASRAYPELKKWGLLLPADPALNAEKANVFWHPNVFKSVVRFHVLDKDDINLKRKPIQISKFPASITHFREAEGHYHIRFLGENFWFQIHCNELKSVDENAYIGLEFNSAIDPERRIKTLSEIIGIYNGSIPLSSQLHVPARLISHQKASIAFDVRTAGGTWRDVAIALKGEKSVNKNPDNFENFKQDARNHYNRGKAFVYGGYLKILDKN